MAVHGELRPDDNALPLIVAAAALNKADSAMTRPTGSVRVDNGDGTETWMGEAASENGGIIQWVGDTTPPAQPTGVSAECVAGTIIVSWDGTLAEPIPPDFSHVEVYARADNADNTIDVGRLHGAGSVTITGYPEGTIFDIWAVAYDDAHNQAGESTPNASPKSDVVTVIIEPVVSQQQLADKAKEILSAASEDAAKQVSRVQSDLTSTKQQVESNTSGVQAASTQIADMDSRLSSLSSQMTSGLKDATDTANTAKTTADNAANTANTAVQKVSDLSTQLTQVKQTADGKNRIYLAETAPTGTGLTPGDQWYQRSDYRTYAEGEPDKSDSIMEIPSSRIRGVYVWDGSSWNEKNFVASNILATGTVGAKELAADAIYGKTLQGGKVIGGTVRGADFTLTDSTLATTIAQANSSGVFFGDSLSYAQVNGKWVLTVKDGVQSGGDLSGVTVTGSTIQTTATDSRGVKITSGGLVAYDQNGAATLTVDATTGSILMKGAVSTNSTLNTPAINSGTVTGAVFQSSEAADTGIKINSTALQMWDSAHNRTVYLDGEGKNNVLTGSFQTATTGNRVEIYSQATSTIIGSSTSLSGQSIVFQDDNFAGTPEIFGTFTNSDLGDAPRIALLSGWKTDHDPAATLFLQSWPRSKGATGSGITSRAFMSADTDYTEPDSTKKSCASLDLEGIGGTGAYASLKTYAYYGSQAQTWVTATRNDGVTQVGIGADAFTQSIYLGGRLGAITNQATFQTVNCKILSGTLGADGTLQPATCALAPAKYGVYHAVANSDCPWGSVFAHVLNTGNASQYQVMCYNAGHAAFTGDIWIDAIAWLI